MDGREKVSLVALGVSLLVVSVTIVLPLITLPQTERLEGPEMPYGNSTYAISAYYIPTVPQGSDVRVELSGYAPGSAILTLFPTTQNDVAPAGSPIVRFESPAAKNVSDSFVSPASQPYGIYVVSYNGTGYQLVISSDWSPYYVVRIYVYPAAFVLIACAILAFYFRQTAPRRRWEREALGSIPRQWKLLRTRRASPGQTWRGKPCAIAW